MFTGVGGGSISVRRRGGEEEEGTRGGDWKRGEEEIRGEGEGKRGEGEA